MSDKSNTKTNDSEALKKFKSSCSNFIKMLAEEKSDSIKINYLLGLTKLSQKLNLPPEITVETIFKNILFQNIDIIKTPSLLFSFMSFCRKTHDQTFQKNFYELLQLLGNDYKANNIYFKDYLIMISLEIFFDSVKDVKQNAVECEERKNFFDYIIDTDIKEFKEQLFKIIINNDIKLMDNKLKINFILNILEKIIIKTKYNFGLMLLKIVKEELNSNLPDDIIEFIIKTENEIGFNSLVKKSKGINEFIIFNIFMLNNMSKEFANNEKNNTLIDVYLSNILNILCIQNEFNIQIINYIYNYYCTDKYKILGKIFQQAIYYLSSFANSYNQINFLFNTICKSKIMSPIYKWLIFKNPILSNKASFIQTDFKPNLNGINIVLEMDKMNKKDMSIIDTLDKSLLTINEDQSNINRLIHLSLYDYILSSSFMCNDNNYNINFYKLNRILKIIYGLSLEVLNKQFYNDFIRFLLDYFSVIFEFFLTKKIKDCKNADLIMETFKSFLYLFKKMPNQKEDQLSFIFPSLIILLTNKNIEVKLIEPIVDYMIDIFGRKTRQCEMIFKSMKTLLMSIDQKSQEDKFLLADKMISLVIESNEHKLFELLFSFCNELTKTKNNFNLKLHNYIINKYSKIYSGALSDLLQRYIIDKFDGAFVQKKITIDELNDNSYYVLNTINNIYLQDKPVNLQDIIDKFYGNNKSIIDIFDKLFEFMDKDENNKNIFESNSDKNSNVNLIEKYCNMKDNIKELSEYYSYIKKDINDKLITIYCNTYYLVLLFTQYLSEKINNEKTIENEEEKKIENDKLMLIFDYIYEKVLLNRKIKNITFKSFFINAFLSNRDVLDYYLVKHTNNLVNSQIKEKELDFSQLTQLSSSINKKKSFGLIDLLKNNPFNVLLINQLIIELFNYESDVIINPQKVDLYKNVSDRPLIIKNIYHNKILDKIIDSNEKNNNKNNESASSTSKDVQMRINTCFSKIFFEEITDLSNKKGLECNQVFFIFCLDNEIFNNYYSSFCTFYDFDYILLEFYSLVRNKKCILDFKEKFLEFLKNFSFIENINIFTLRLLSNEKSFEKLIIKSDSHSKKTLLLVYDIIILLLDNLLKYNSYQNYTENVIINILKNAFLYLDELFSFSQKDNTLSELLFKEIYYLGKMINYILYDYITSDNNNNKSQNINPKLKKVLSDFLSKEIISKYIITFFSSISHTFKSNINYSLQSIYCSFYFIIDFLEDINIKNDVLKAIDKKEVLEFIDSFSFFKTNEVTNNAMSKLLINYSKSLKETNHLYIYFIEHLFLFVIRNSQYSNEKIIKELILVFLDENNTSGFKDIYDKKKFGYLCYYYLLYKRNSNPLNKDNSYLEKVEINVGDFDLVANIGERLRVDI